MKKLLFETDWLGSQPVFYNVKTDLASKSINDVIDFTNLEFHPEGFNNFLDFGYSVLEQTPVINVKFLRHSSRLWQDEKGKLEVEYLEDPVEKWLNFKLSEEEIIDLIKNRVRSWEQSVEGEIVLPLSGGYDSRLLAWCIKDKSRVRAYTYGISENQSDSFEVVNAQKLSEILGFNWQHISLGDFHQYFDDWDQLFGISTHAHGMYHIEFYKKILLSTPKGNPFLSGIIGDAWAGSVNIPTMESHIDVLRLGYTHGMQADSTKSLLGNDRQLILDYWGANKDRLKDSRFRVIEAMRFKIILLCYLRIVPHWIGFNWWSPFIDIDIAMAMLNLPPARKHNRLWQDVFFRKVGLDLASMNLQANVENTLDLQALHRMPVNPLDVNLLKDIFSPDYVEWINRNIQTSYNSMIDRLIDRLLRVRKIGGALKMIGFREKSTLQLEAYKAYVVLLPIERLLHRKEDIN